MANWDIMQLSANNAEKFKEAMQNFDPRVRTRAAEWQEDDSIVYSATPLPVEAVRELSGRYPDLTFTAICRFEHTMFSQAFTVEFERGEERIVRVEPAYAWPECNEAIPYREQLEEKLESVFKRLDIPKDNPAEGIDWVDAEVTVSVEHDGYKMEAKKRNCIVDDVKVLKAYKVETTEWREFDDDIPF